MPFIWVRSVKSDEFLFADGNVLANRSFSKLVTGESGWNYMAGKFEIYGAAPCPAGVDEKREPSFFRRRRLTRRQRNTGKLRYVCRCTIENYIPEQSSVSALVIGRRAAEIFERSLFLISQCFLSSV